MERSENASAVPAAVSLVQAFLASRRLHELPDEVFQLGVVWSACERCVAERDADGADRLYRLLASFAGGGAERAGGAFWLGAAAHYLGTLASVLARWETAAAHFEDALRVGAAGAPLDIRPTQLAYIRMLLARGAPGDDARAERLLAEFIAGLHLLRSSGRVESPPAIGSGDFAPVRSAPPARHDAASRYAFKREGDYWTLVADGRLSRLRNLRGLEFTAELLRHPYEPIYVVDLAGLGVASEGRLSVEEAAEQGLRVSAESDAVPALDRRARDDYRARWRELLVEEADARHDNDVGRAARIQHEIDMLAEQLAAVAGAGGCGRSGPSVKERARVNVRNCITKALRAVRHHDERLWRHLSNSIKTGTFCCYTPDRPVVWEM
jgi:hypothetical protein